MTTDNPLSALVATGLGLLEAYVAAHNAYIQAATDRPQDCLRDLAIAADDARRDFEEWGGDNARALLEGCAAMERERRPETSSDPQVDDSWSGRLATMRAELDAALVDARRLLFVSKMMDGIGDVDFHWEASVHAEGNDRDEANDDDYLYAIRVAIDAAMGAPSSSGEKK